MIYQDIKLITDQLSEKHTFVSYNESNANVIADDIEKDEFFIIMDSYNVTGQYSKVGTFLENLNVTILFLSNYSKELDYQTELDDNSLQKDTIQRSAYNLAKEFLLLYKKRFPYVDNAQGRQQVRPRFNPIEYLFNSNMHGIALEVSLPVILPFDYCLSEPFAYDIDYQRLLNYWEVQNFELPSIEARLVQNQLIINLKMVGVWDLLETYFVFANNNKNTSYTCWKRLIQCDEVSLGSGEVLHKKNSWIAGDGIETWIETKFIPQNYTNVTNQNFAVSFFVNEENIQSDSDGWILGSNLSSSDGLTILNQNPLFGLRYFINERALGNLASNDLIISNSLYVMDILGADKKLIINDAPISEVVNILYPIQSSPITLFTYRLLGFTKTKMSFFSGGQSLFLKTSYFTEIQKKYLNDIKGL